MGNEIFRCSMFNSFDEEFKVAGIKVLILPCERGIKEESGVGILFSSSIISIKNSLRTSLKTFIHFSLLREIIFPLNFVMINYYSVILLGNNKKIVPYLF